MTKKKELKSRDIAGMHWFIAGFAVPALVAIVVTIILSIMFKSDSRVLAVMLLITELLSIWFGIKTSAKYLNKRYVIKKPKKVVQISTLLFILINGGYATWQMSKVGTVVFVGITVVHLLLNTILFYVLSRIYIRS